MGIGDNNNEYMLYISSEVYVQTQSQSMTIYQYSIKLISQVSEAQHLCWRSEILGRAGVLT